MGYIPGLTKQSEKSVFNKRPVGKLVIFILSCVVVFGLLAACAKASDSSKISTVKDSTQAFKGKPDLMDINLYFPTQTNDAIKLEKHLETVDGSLVKTAISGLMKGPEDKNLRKAIPDGTTLLDVQLNNGLATVNFSKEFSYGVNGIAEIVEKISLVNTLTDIEGINAVKIMIEGKELIGPSGIPVGVMRKTVLDENGMPVSDEEKVITLYFGDSNAEWIVAETRTIGLPKGEKLEEAVFNELIMGSMKEGYSAQIPKGTRLISVETKDGICTLNLSKEFVDNNLGGTARESIIIDSIVNSLTEIEGIKKVQFLIEGEKREVYTHLAFDKPFERNESRIKK